MAKTLLSIQDLRSGAGRNAEATGLLGAFRASQSIASRVSTPRIIGPYVCCPLARLMPTPRLAPRSMSKAFCAAIMI